jgi:hypothetical protein
VLRTFDDGGDCVFRAAHHRFHAAVASIAHPAADVQLLSLVNHVTTKAHALYKTVNRQMAGDHFTHG